MGFQGVQRKLTKLQNLYEEEHCEKIILNGLTLVKSGIMFDMFIQAIENGKVWNIESINDYIKMNGHKINANELYRVYWQRYYDSFVAIY